MWTWPSWLCRPLRAASLTPPLLLLLGSPLFAETPLGGPAIGVPCRGQAPSLLKRVAHPASSMSPILVELEGARRLIPHLPPASTALLLPTPITTGKPGGGGKAWSVLPKLHQSLLLAAALAPPPLVPSGSLALAAPHPHPPILAVWYPLSSLPWGSWREPSIADVVMSLAVPVGRSGWACSQSVNLGQVLHRQGNLTQALEGEKPVQWERGRGTVGTAGKLSK